MSDESSVTATERAEAVLDRGLAETADIGAETARFEIFDPEGRQVEYATVPENGHSVCETG